MKVKREEIINQGYESSLINISYWILVPFFFLAFIIPFVFSLFWLILSIITFLKKKTRFARIEQKPIYKQDLRYTTGRKVVGYSNKKVYSKHKAEITPDEKKENYKIGSFYFVIFLLSFMLSCRVYL